MTTSALSGLEQARREALLSQTLCSYCGKQCEDNDHLITHLMLRHPLKRADRCAKTNRTYVEIDQHIANIVDRLSPWEIREANRILTKILPTPDEQQELSRIAAKLSGKEWSP